MAGTSSPYPYVVFGPPGTGKTVTVVEAIKQVWKTFKSSRIVVCAPSNAAADVLAVRLVKDADIPLKEILRLMAPAREGIEIDEELEDITVYGT